MATKLDRKTLRFLKATAQNVYEPFFKNLLKPYKSSDPIAKGIFEILDDVHRLDQIVDKVIRNGVSIATMSDSITINKLVQKIEVNKDELLNVIANDEATKAHSNVGTTPADLKFSQQFATGKETMPSEQSKQPSAFQRGPVGGILSAFGLNTGGRIAGAAALGAIARPVLGPYMYPAMAALGGIGLAHGAFKKFRSKHKGKLSSVRPSLQTVGSIEGDTPTGTPDYGIGGSGTYSTTGGGTLVHFFDKDWKKAKWTKDIYKALVDGKTKDDSRTSRGILAKLIGGAVVAGLIGWAFSGTETGKNIADKTKAGLDKVKAKLKKGGFTGVTPLTTIEPPDITERKRIAKLKRTLKPEFQNLDKYPPATATAEEKFKFYAGVAAKMAVDSIDPVKQKVESIQESPVQPNLILGSSGEPIRFDKATMTDEENRRALIKENTEALKQLDSTIRDSNSQSLENDPFTDPLLPLRTLLGPVK